MNLIIDGSNLLHRSYWVAEKSPDFNENNSSSVGYYFLKSLKTLVQKFNPETVWVAWDKRLTANSTNFRKKLLNGAYKSQRDGDRSARVVAHYDYIHSTLSSLGIKQLYPNVLEADDVISWLSQRLDTRSVVVSVDKDLLQLINTKVTVYNPIKKIVITNENFCDVVGVEKENYIKYKALLGDESDNISGIERYGIQRCKKLCVESVTSIKQILSTEQYDIFERNIQVMDLSNSYNIEPAEAAAYDQQFIDQLNIRANFKQFELLCNDYGYHSILRDIQTWKRHFVSQQKISDLISKLNSA